MLLEEVGQKNKEGVWSQFFCKRWKKKDFCPACALGTIYLVKIWCLLSLFITAFSWNKQYWMWSPRWNKTFFGELKQSNGHHSDLLAFVLSFWECHRVAKSALAPRLACSAWETWLCPEGVCLYLSKLNTACEISSFPLSLQCLDWSNFSACQMRL